MGTRSRVPWLQEPRLTRCPLTWLIRTEAATEPRKREETGSGRSGSGVSGGEIWSRPSCFVPGTEAADGTRVLNSDGPRAVVTLVIHPQNTCLTGLLWASPRWVTVMRAAGPP